jgi:hypothetical protein
MHGVSGRVAPLGLINYEGAGGASLPLPLTQIPRIHLLPCCTPRRFESASDFCAYAPLALPIFFLHGSDLGAGPFCVAPIDGDPTVARGVGEWQAAVASR